MLVRVYPRIEHMLTQVHNYNPVIFEISSEIPLRVLQSLYAESAMTLLLTISLASNQLHIMMAIDW